MEVYFLNRKSSIKNKILNFFSILIGSVVGYGLYIYFICISGYAILLISKSILNVMIKSISSESVLFELAKIELIHVVNSLMIWTAIFLFLYMLFGLSFVFLIKDRKKVIIYSKKTFIFLLTSCLTLSLLTTLNEAQFGLFVTVISLIALLYPWFNKIEMS